jgi:hypothetical protein
VSQGHPPGRFAAHVRAHIVGYLALFVALSGTAIALPGKRVIDKNDLKPNVVKGKHVVPDSLTGADVLEPSLNVLLPTSVAGGDVSGTFANLQVAPGAIGTGEQATAPAARVRHNAGTPVTDSTTVTVPFNTETGTEFDIGGLHATATDDCTLANNSCRLTAPIAGVYAITANVSWAPDGGDTGVAFIGLRLNGAGASVVREDSAFPTVGSLGVSQSIAATLQLNQGDFIELQAYQDNATNNSLSVLASPSSPTVTMTWLAPHS